MSQTELEAKRTEAMQIMSEWLFVLRSALNVTQEQIAFSVGMSRQTYSALELNKKKMTWNAFLSLFLFFMLNEKSRNLLSKKPGYIFTVFILLDVNAENLDINGLLSADKEKPIDSIEEIFKGKFS